ncbi:intraflagellar transport protein 52 [Nephila pilipes]|uniref:Intraflagellar transport protein 52 n=1 Tax=Nephila pilipes TaxID=299642 RepID=A0A8X6UGE3_NEPPI|nr:intraflagellar transport protein 52 [Nephila pilipes]
MPCSDKVVRNTITIDASKSELLSLDNLKTCCRKLVSIGYRVAVNKGPISKETLSQTMIFVMLCPTEKFKTSELKTLKKFIKRGGRLLVTGNEGKKISDINSFLKDYGIEFNNDAVIRFHRWSGFHHPKESVVTDGIINKALYSMGQDFQTSDMKVHKNFRYLYPYGCTLNVDIESIILLATGTTCFPFNRPTCAFYKYPATDGRIIAFGSTMALSDSYISKVENIKLLSILITLLSEDDIQLNAIDIQCPDITDYSPMPDIGKLAEFPYTCLQESEEELFHSALVLRTKPYQYDNRHVPKVLDAYKELSVSPSKLKIIKPKFEAPLPELKPAVIPPRFRGLPNPDLELMDLDDFFISPNAKLDILSSKCKNNDLEYYITEFGKMVNLPTQVRNGNGKKILEHICSQLLLLKRYMV